MACAARLGLRDDVCLMTCNDALVGVSVSLPVVQKRNAYKHTHTQTDTYTRKLPQTHTQNTHTKTLRQFNKLPTHIHKKLRPNLTCFLSNEWHDTNHVSSLGFMKVSECKNKEASKRHAPRSPVPTMHASQLAQSSH